MSDKLTRAEWTERTLLMRYGFLKVVDEVLFDIDDITKGLVKGVIYSITDVSAYTPKEEESGDQVH